MTLQTVPPVLLSVSSTMLEICAISKSLDFFIFQQEDLAKIEGTVSQDFNPVFHDFNPNSSVFLHIVLYLWICNCVIDTACGVKLNSVSDNPE